MLYALGTGNYLNDKIESLVLVAPCLYVNFGATYESLVYQFMAFKEEGIFSLGGDDWADSQQWICDNFGEQGCDFYKYFPTASPGPVNSM